MISVLVQATVEQFWGDLGVSPYWPLMLKGSVGDDLEHLEKDRAIKTDPDDNRKRRTIRLVKKNDSWGFALQTYGVKNKRTNEIEVMTYVDYVEYNGPAWIAGLQRGDIFLSINGEPVEGVTHKQLVQKIRQAGDAMRVVVLFEDCCRKVELYEKFIKLKQVLSFKLQELQQLKVKENLLLKAGGLKRIEEIRLSTRSTQSSISSDWDRYSMVGNSVSLSNIPTHIRGKRKLLTVTNDSLSDISFDNASFSDSDSCLNLNSSATDLFQTALKQRSENIDNVSEYSLPLNTHANFQLGGKMLRFSEDDISSIGSFDNIVPKNKLQTVQSCDIRHSEITCVKVSDIQIVVSESDDPVESGDDLVISDCESEGQSSSKLAEDKSHVEDQEETESVSTETGRFENGIIISEKDELTKL
ncbi:hypothetical protein LOTGIDRAFT_238811 [Lottia gigantea]|uniref:PDZ domain-containing protein n=1 Tax=Lottia gigantea TaxID=225164 RepID=V4AZP3_LOTGI|nr:hypothetical protein LOTGIDRAFT_238811 [Lottia gigantea]ESO99196.1 hypothetical protein LOTGIDRAFT_238811 [Lottia gigantea]